MNMLDRSKIRYALVNFKCTIKEPLSLQLARCIQRLSIFAEKYKDQPTLGYTHFQYVYKFLSESKTLGVK